MSYDAIVIGGSFAGLSAALQLARARRRVLVIDAGQPRNRLAAFSHGFLTQDHKPPRQIIAQGRRQLAAYPTVEFVNGEAVEARPQDSGFLVALQNGRTELTSRLVLAIGVRDELPDLPGLAQRWGETVLHCPYCHGYEVQGQALGVLATHARSTRQALLVPDWGPTTYFTQGIVELTDDEKDQLTNREVQLETVPIVELLGEAPALDAVRLADNRIVRIQALFTAPRTHVSSALADQLGCSFEEGPVGRYIKVDDSKQTTVPRVYAAGDAASATSNATVAAAAGVLAGINAHQSLFMDGSCVTAR